MQAGAGQTNITPLLGTSLAGYFQDRKAARVHDELHAKALVLDDGETRVAFVICDLIVIPYETVLEARDLILAETGIPQDNVLIAATHTHTGPSPTGLLGTPRAEDYMKALPSKIADSVRRACSVMAPAKWGAALGEERRLTFNRRYRMRDGSVVMNPGVGNPEVVEPVGPIDPDLAVLHVVHAETGRTIAILANFALHYVGGRDGLAVSADYFGMFAETIRRWRGEECVVALANGFCADVNNVDVMGVGGMPRHTEGWEQAKHVARVLAADVIRLIELTNVREEGSLRIAREVLSIPRRPVTEEMRQNARVLLGDRSPHGPADGYSRDEIYAREILLLDEMPEKIETEIQVIALDEVGFVGMPGEMFAQYGLDLRERSPLSPLFKIELANGYVGYVPTRKAFDDGGYETWLARSSCLHPEAGNWMVDRAQRLLTTVAEG